MGFAPVESFGSCLTVFHSLGEPFALVSRGAPQIARSFLQVSRISLERRLAALKLRHVVLHNHVPSQNVRCKACSNQYSKACVCRCPFVAVHCFLPSPQAMVLDAPDSLQVVSLEQGRVAETDRVVVRALPSVDCVVPYTSPGTQLTVGYLVHYWNPAGVFSPALLSFAAVQSTLLVEAVFFQFFQFFFFFSPAGTSIDTGVGFTRKLEGQEGQALEEGAGRGSRRGDHPHQPHRSG